VASKIDEAQIRCRLSSITAITAETALTFAANRHG
jgi:hypothetical protein